MERKNPKTSIEAYKSLTPEMLSSHQGKILKALAELGKANYEIIANKIKLERHAVGRRLSELERSGLVHKVGTTSKTKSGRNAYDYTLTFQIQTDRELQEFWDKYQNGDFDKPGGLVQAELF